MNAEKRKEREQKIDAMAEMYEKGSTLQQISNHYSLTRERVRQLLNERGIRGRERESEAKQIRHGRCKQIIRDSSHLSLKAIAKIAGIRLKTVSKYAKGLVRQNLAEARWLNKYPHLTREKMYEEYIVKDKTQMQLADEWGIRQTTISDRLRKWGIVKLTRDGDLPLPRKRKSVQRDSRSAAARQRNC